MAIEEGAALVPVVVMGEVDALRNFVDMPRVQSWTYKKLGFPVPYLVVGRWGLSPLPRQTGLKFVIGEPIQPPQHTPGQQVCASSAPPLTSLPQPLINLAVLYLGEKYSGPCSI